MAGADRRHPRRGTAFAADATRQGQVVQDRARAVRQVARRQSAGGGAHLHVRRARRVVRGRPAGVSLRQRLEVSRSRRLPRALDDRLRRHPGARAFARARAAPTASAARCPPRDCGRSCSPRFRSLLALLLRDPEPMASRSGSSSPALRCSALPFAVNSSLHSYLILAYAGSEKAAEDVGFYYAANATGRLIGILLSGALYQIGRHRRVPRSGRPSCSCSAGSSPSCCLAALPRRRA